MSTRQPRTADGEAGFTVTESLVALFVFALAGVSLVQMQTQSVQTLTRVEMRTLAGLAAENQLVEEMARIDGPVLGAREGESDLGGRVWRLRLDVTATSDPAVYRVESQVFVGGGEGGGAEPTASMTAFRVAGAGQ